MSSKSRIKASEYFVTNSTQFKETIKASLSEIMKDLQQISNSIPVTKRICQNDNDLKKNQKMCNSQKIRKAKPRITEDISPILGLASLINEMDTPQLMILQSITKQQKFPGKKTVKLKKSKIEAKIICCTRAETHIGIARFINKSMTQN